MKLFAMLILLILLSCVINHGNKNVDKNTVSKTDETIKDSTLFVLKDSINNGNYRLVVITNIWCNDSICMNPITNKLEKNNGSNWYFINYCNVNTATQIISFEKNGVKSTEMSSRTLVDTYVEQTGDRDSDLNVVLEYVWLLKGKYGDLYLLDYSNFYYGFSSLYSMSGELLWYKLQSKPAYQSGNYNTILKKYGIKENSIDDDNYLRSCPILEIF